MPRKREVRTWRAMTSGAAGVVLEPHAMAQIHVRALSRIFANLSTRASGNVMTGKETFHGSLSVGSKLAVGLTPNNELRAYANGQITLDGHAPSALSEGQPQLFLGSGLD